MDLLNLSDIEVRVLRRGLKRLKYEAEQNLRRNQRKGWKPVEGKIDLNAASIETADSLLARLPFPDYPDDNVKP
jgi:hypothetical protein